MFLGLTEPTSGKVRVCGHDPARDPLRVKEKVGYLPENVGFYDDMDARAEYSLCSQAEPYSRQRLQQED